MLFRGQTFWDINTMLMMFLTNLLKSIENGIDIIRIFDALNDIRNLKCAVDSKQMESVWSWSLPNRFKLYN